MIKHSLSNERKNKNENANEENIYFGHYKCQVYQS